MLPKDSPFKQPNVTFQHTRNRWVSIIYRFSFPTDSFCANVGVERCFTFYASGASQILGTSQVGFEIEPSSFLTSAVMSSEIDTVLQPSTQFAGQDDSVHGRLGTFYPAPSIASALRFSDWSSRPHSPNISLQR